MEVDNDYYEQKLYEIPPDVLEGSVEALKKHIPENLKKSLVESYKKCKPGEWWFAEYHFGLGMSIRNALRQLGFSDRRLPDKNWDDYYVKVVEIAIGLREMPNFVK